MPLTWRPQANRASRIKWELQMGGPPDNIIESVKHLKQAKGDNAFEQKNWASSKQYITFYPP
jgi:hypothetical protein